MARAREENPWAARICWGFAVISLAILAALVYFAQPMGDDFRWARPQPLWPEAVRQYHKSGGRWMTGILVNVITPSIDLVRGYSTALALLLILRLLAAYALTRAVLDPQIGGLRCAMVSTTFCILYWSAMPAVGDSLFWLNGAIYYELTATGVMFFLAFLLSRRLDAVRTGVLAIGAVGLTGSHEIAAVFLTAAILGGLLLRFRDRSPDWPWWAALLVAAAGGTAVAVFAPGNFVRAAQIGGTHRLAAAGSTAALNMLTWIPRWALDAPVVLALCVLLIDPAIRLRPDWTPPGRHLRLVLAGIPAIALLAGFFIPGWGTGGLMAGRLLNWLYLLFLAALLVHLLLWKATRQTGIAVSGNLRSAARVLFFGAMLVAGNFRLGAFDLALRIPRWAASRRAALAGLEARHRDGGSATFPELPPYPHVYFDYDVTSNPEAYPNRSVARYYGLQSVTGPGAPVWPDGAALSGRTFSLKKSP
jgi:hypothetical protein